MKVLENINEKKGTTILMVTHDKDIVNKMKKDVITLKDGRITSIKERGTYDEDI